MSKPKLSILVPVIPGRILRLRAILERVSLSMKLYNEKFSEEKLDPKKDVEFVIVDGGDEGPVKEMCEAVGRAHLMKYIYLPIGRFINAAYPRNVGLRACEGDVIGHLDVDHFPGEFIVEGMLRPFLDGRIDRHINRGYVVDSSKSPSGAGPNVGWLEGLNHHLLEKDGGQLKCKIADLYDKAGIPAPGTNNTLWVWAARREYIDELNGYDELYCRRFAYCREDDDWRERMLAHGMPFWDGANKQFCAIHLWHPAPHRTDAKTNEINKEYFDQVCRPVKSVSRNENHAWGRWIRGSFSIINGEYRELVEHETWVKKHRPEVPYYLNEWKDVDALLDELEIQAQH